MDITDTAYFWVPGKLPSLNELLDERARMYYNPKIRKKIFTEGNLKKSCQQKVYLRACQAGFYAPTSGFWSYLFVESKRNRDPSNISAGAVKIIEDALVVGQLAPGDGWSSVLGIAVHFLHDKEIEGVLVVWNAMRTCQRADILDLFNELKGKRT